jgi:hypothetical protein
MAPPRIARPLPGSGSVARLSVAVVAVAMWVGASVAFGAYPGTNGKLLFLRTNPAIQNDLGGTNWDEIGSRRRPAAGSSG